MYSVSNLTTSSKSGTSLFPLTCQSPVSPGLEADPSVVVGRVLPHFVGSGRSGPDQAHLAAEDVIKLRQLVDVGVAEPCPEVRHARITRHLEHRATHLVVSAQRVELALGVGHHRSNLVQLEGPAIEPDTLLREENGTGDSFLIRRATNRSVSRTPPIRRPRPRCRRPA